MLKRRDFLKSAAFGTAALALESCRTHSAATQVVAGEEWRLDKPLYDASGNYFLTPEMRAQADEAIVQHRTADFTIRLLDGKRNPQPAQEVQIKLLNHHFDWGFSGAKTIDATDELSQRQTYHFKKLFNCTTAKCYWDERWHQPIEHQEGKRITGRFESEIHWALANGLKVKGHPLVWTVRKAIPSWMDKYDYAVQLKKLEAHVRDLIRVGGQEVSQWDLCNEMLWEPSLRNLPHRDWPHLEPVDEILTYLEPAVHWAKEENPHASYVLNDYGLVKTNAPGVTARQQRQRYLALAKEMQRRGCAPDALGAQCHVAGWYSAQEFAALLEDLSEAALPLQITEFFGRQKDCPFDVSEDEKAKARMAYVEMIYTLAFAHPSVHHFTYWGGDWFDKNADPTPLYHVVHRLVKEKWVTELKLKAQATGEFKARAFYGDYVLIWKDEKGNQHPLHFSLNKGQRSVNLQAKI
ncbi:MAG: endo-1,4-beta-xylanase [Cyclobacteriaceae bacterium]